MAKKNSVKDIKKELSVLIKYKFKICLTAKERNKAVENARQEINTKYGKGWREGETIGCRDKDYYPSIYDDHTYGEYWMD